MNFSTLITLFISFTLFSLALSAPSTNFVESFEGTEVAGVVYAFHLWWHAAELVGEYPVLVASDNLGGIVHTISIGLNNTKPLDISKASNVSQEVIVICGTFGIEIYDQHGILVESNYDTPFKRCDGSWGGGRIVAITDEDLYLFSLDLDLLDMIDTTPALYTDPKNEDVAIRNSDNKIAVIANKKLVPIGYIFNTPYVEIYDLTGGVSGGVFDTITASFTFFDFDSIDLLGLWEDATLYRGSFGADGILYVLGETNDASSAFIFDGLTGLPTVIEYLPLFTTNYDECDNKLYYAAYDIQPTAIASSIVHTTLVVPFLTPQYNNSVPSCDVHMPNAGIEASSGGTVAMFVSQNKEAIYIVRSDWENGLETPRWLSTNMWNDTEALARGVAFDDNEELIGGVFFGDDGTDGTTNFQVFNISDPDDKMMPLIWNVREYEAPSRKRSIDFGGAEFSVEPGEMKRSVEAPSCQVGSVNIIGPGSGAKFYMQCHNDWNYDLTPGNTNNTQNCGNYSVDLAYWLPEDTCFVANVQSNELVSGWTYSYFNWYWLWRSYSRTDSSYPPSTVLEFEYDIYRSSDFQYYGAHRGRIFGTGGDFHTFGYDSSYPDCGPDCNYPRKYIPEGLSLSDIRFAYYLNVVGSQIMYLQYAR